MTEIEDKTLAVEQRERWVALLRAGYMFHQQEVKETKNPIIGAEPSDIHLFHMAVSVAIQDCIEMIQEMEALGYFEEAQLSTPGLAG